MLYYKNFELEDTIDHINEDQNHLLYACCYLVDYRASIRETARNCGFSKSTLHRKIHKDLKILSPELYGCVCKQLKRNEKKRGCQNGYNKYN